MQWLLCLLLDMFLKAKKKYNNSKLIIKVIKFNNN